MLFTWGFFLGPLFKKTFYKNISRFAHYFSQ